ncbi:helix-turn-helix domain-containing protein [Succinivibrio dextrinosolvens]|uniref:helix-turn-helix domain-containing protein n=1 Tax=Succinivibrio dextrinosolvens TaxID=83771 RepID=UPI0019240945|nr:helix-turn-helix transcriptional regulator [Succinivibrio dextrinosolvens]MBE6422896.1 helix-turn-helix transcriptional regulator [Succinivibrio dextrinosolvens]
MGNDLFAARIKALRTKNNLSQDGLAKKLKVTKSRVAMWESSGTIPRNDVLRELSSLFSVSVDYLLGNEQMENQCPDNKRLQVLQRGLSKLDDAGLEKAQKILSAVFEDIFVDENGISVKFSDSFVDTLNMIEKKSDR